MKNLKVLNVIPSLSLVHGGPSRAMQLIERALRDQGVVVETATTDDDGPGRSTGHPLGIAVEQEAATRHYFRKTLDSYKVSTSLARWLFGNVRSYDLVHIHALFSFSSAIAAWAAHRSGVPYVVRPLGTLASYGMAQRRPWLKRLSVLLVEGPILRNAAAVHFTSEMERDEAASLGIHMRPAIIPLAVEQPVPADIDRLLAKFPGLRGQPWVLYLSRLDPKKNVEGLLHAISACAAEFPDIRWLIAGDGDPAYVAGLHALGNRLGIGGNVVWCGHLQGGEKTAAFSNAEVFVLPSYSENFGIAVAEALQAGLPVVLGRGVALASLVVQAGAGIAVSSDPEGIAAGLLAYLRDPTSRVRAGSKAAQLAEREFSVTTMGSRLVAVYEIILAAPDRKWPGETCHA